MRTVSIKDEGTSLIPPRRMAVVASRRGHEITNADKAAFHRRSVLEEAERVEQAREAAELREELHSTLMRLAQEG